MKNRYRRILALTVCVALTFLALCAGTASAEERNAGILGMPFPDFTAADTEGNTFSLSEALKDHEAVLKEIPRDTSTHAYPVSASRAIYPESGNYRKVMIRSDQNPEPIIGYIIPDDSVRLRIEICPDDDAACMVCTNMLYGEIIPVTSLLDSDRDVYGYDVEMPDASDAVHYLMIALYDGVAAEDTRQTAVYLYINEEAVKETVAEANEEGPGKWTWEYADTGEQPENVLQAYIMHVVDQDGNPVEEVTVNFCTDVSCVPKESDEDGLITFTGAPDAYHVTIVDAPDGYSWDEDYGMYTPREYGEWVLRVKKE